MEAIRAARQLRLGDLRKLRDAGALVCTEGLDD
jgi:hypothetical protein